MNSPSFNPGAMAPPASFARRMLYAAPVRIVIGILAIGLTAALAYAAARAMAPAPRLIWPHLLAAVLVTLVYVGYVRLFERRAVTELAAAGAARQWGVGTALGAGAVLAVMAALAASGSYHFTALRPWSLAIIAPLAEMLFAGLFEEILFRGVLFRITERALGSWPALLISSLLFAAAHLGDSITVIGLINTALAGLMLCAAFMLTRRLWLGIGIHAAWNYTLGSICSIAVSGHAGKGWMAGTVSGPDWLTGGAYGLEASLLTTVVMGVLFAALYGRARRAGQVLRRGAASPVIT
ncbi:CPBP family intramembrane glutamic endopeptidase [Massilia sp. PWRC2]|uniref:CPBP family intramembrane glutamic endopeptidase n=1 Tax=Massilia sp. PWRC2 TaxID=2804626 RepID=UPI003CEE2266